MEDILQKLAHVIEHGKINRATPYPPELQGQDGASELTLRALEQGLEPKLILNQGLMPGMGRVGDKFSRGEVFIANMLISAKAMNAAMEYLRPLFSTGDITPRGTIVLGTVEGDLHDIGKNLVKMIMKGDGWDVIDLGTDVSSEKFVEAVLEHTEAIVGMSALLTTTMLNMESVVNALRESTPETKIFIGGAPVSQAFSDEIGADGYFRDPHSFARSLAVD
ncbi:MAG: corrinoid protein [Candidatus Marinimicrobia bacterium]|nr:corrinoid protein [Candidatus Neomarinimicrobiota bacterium]